MFFAYIRKLSEEPVIVTIFIVLAISIGIGYAYLETDLKINSSVHLNGKPKPPTAVEYINKIASNNNADKTSTDIIGNTGLAYDGTDDNNLRYVGANPDNYVTFNNELWRIIGVMNNIDDGTGKKESRIKLIRNETLGSYSWDTSEKNINRGQGINDWSQADLMYELNYDYLGNIIIGNDGKWKVNLDMPKTKLSNESKSIIDNALWNLGGANTGTAIYMYNCERGTEVYSGNQQSGLVKLH